MAATEIAVIVYAPLKFDLLKLAPEPDSNPDVLNAPADVISRGMHHLVIGTFSFNES